MQSDEYRRAVEAAERRWAKIVWAVPDKDWHQAAAGRFPRPRRDCSGMAAAAAVLAIVGLVVWPLGAAAVGLGLRVVWLSRKRRALGYGRAVAAVTLGCCELALIAATLLALIVAHPYK